MADLNLRNISPELIAKLKSNAALNGCTLRDYCIIVLSGWQEPPKAFDWKAKLAETGLKPAMFGGRMDEPTFAPDPPWEMTIVERPIEELKRKFPIIEDDTPVSVTGSAVCYTKQHDPKTCRIYRCGMCAAAKNSSV